MEDIREVRAKWDQRHGDPTLRPAVAEVLLDNRHLLPTQGMALDLACGLGGNALLLAQTGLQVSAWDLSPVAIERLREAAVERDLSNLQVEVRDVEQQPPAAECFDVITVSYYLQRSLFPALITALKPNGLLFYQTFTRVAVTEQGPRNPQYRLADNELLDLCRRLAIRFYREENRLGDLAKGCRGVAMLVAERC